jgi:hypothetical protein
MRTRSDRRLRNPAPGNPICTRRQGSAARTTHRTRGLQEIRSGPESRPEVALPPKVDVASTRRPSRATMRSITWRTASSPSNRRSGTFSIRRFRSTYASRLVHPTPARGIGRIVAIEEVVAGQVFKGRRTSLVAGSASQVFASSRTASEDKDAGHRPGGSARVGHAFKTGVRARARRRVRFPSASATRFWL